jgi:hypothetical protein
VPCPYLWAEAWALSGAAGIPVVTAVNKLFWWAVSEKVRRAKRLLAGMVNGDLSAVNAIGIAVHNVVKGSIHMRLLCVDARMRSTRTADPAAEWVPAMLAGIWRRAANAEPMARASAGE